MENSAHNSTIDLLVDSLMNLNIETNPDSASEPVEIENIKILQENDMNNILLNQENSVITSGEPHELNINANEFIMSEENSQVDPKNTNYMEESLDNSSNDIDANNLNNLCIETISKPNEPKDVIANEFIEKPNEPIELENSTVTNINNIMPNTSEELQDNKKYIEDSVENYSNEIISEENEPIDIDNKKILQESDMNNMVSNCSGEPHGINVNEAEAVKSENNNLVDTKNTNCVEISTDNSTNDMKNLTIETISEENSEQLKENDKNNMNSNIPGEHHELNINAKEFIKSENLKNLQNSNETRRPRLRFHTLAHIVVLLQKPKPSKPISEYVNDSNEDSTDWRALALSRGETIERFMKTIDFQKKRIDRLEHDLNTLVRLAQETQKMLSEFSSQNSYDEKKN